MSDCEMINYRGASRASRFGPFGAGIMNDHKINMRGAETGRLYDVQKCFALGVRTADDLMMMRRFYGVHTPI